MNEYLVKICGLTRLEDALLASRLGAWALGLVFAPSLRQLSLGAAADLVRSLREHEAACRSAGGSVSPAGGTRPPLVVGVFAEDSLDEIVRAVVEVGLDGVQLHGQGGPAALAVRAALEEEGRSALIVRAVPVEPDPEGGLCPNDLNERVAKAARGADLVLLDTKAGENFGGTGRVFPWRYTRKVVVDTPLLVAGGIRPDNVKAALLASGARGVDVSSGVERTPGVKDPELMRRLFQEVREFSRKQRRKEGANR